MENAIAVVHTVGNKSVEYHSRVVVGQCASNRPQLAEMVKTSGRYSLYIGRECQLGVNVNTEAHDTG